MAAGGSKYNDIRRTLGQVLMSVVAARQHIVVEDGNGLDTARLGLFFLSGILATVVHALHTKLEEMPSERATIEPLVVELQSTRDEMDQLHYYAHTMELDTLMPRARALHEKCIDVIMMLQRL